jgi:hypothetical protein
MVGSSLPPRTGARVIDIIAEQTTRGPDAVAVSVDDRSLSYRDLLRRVDRLAEDPRPCSAGPTYSAEWVVALLAALASKVTDGPDRLSHVIGMREAIGIGPDDRVLVIAPSDEMAVRECLAALTAGAELVLPSTPDGIRSQVERYQPTVVFALGREVSALAGVEEPGLRVVCVDTEPPRPVPMAGTLLFLPLAPAGTVWRVEDGRWLGAPLCGVRLDVRDRFGLALPAGLPGELLLDGSPTGVLVRRVRPDALQWLGPVVPDQLDPALQDTPYVAPRNEVEQVIATIWGELVDVERIGVHDNFFQVGGHSLLAMQVITRLTAVFQVEVPVRALFEEPTVAGLAECIAGLERRPGQASQIARIWQHVRTGETGEPAMAATRGAADVR